jgi:hypothetical protein
MQFKGLCNQKCIVKTTGCAILSPSGYKKLPGGYSRTQEKYLIILIYYILYFIKYKFL